MPGFNPRIVALIALCAACSQADCPLLDTEGECEAYRLCRGQAAPLFLYDAAHCGNDQQCIVCPDPGLANASAACFGQTTCGFVCNPSFGDCNGDPSDGCETQLATDPANCGGCGIHCRHECVDGACALRWEGETGVVAVTDGIGPAEPPFRAIWLASDGGTLAVRGGPADGGDAFTLASVPAAPGVAPAAIQSADALWFTDGAGGDGGVFRLAIDAQGAPLTAAPERIASGQDGPGAILVTSEGVYWTNYLGGQLVRAPLDGGAPQILAGDLNHPRQLVTNDERIYWIDEGDGADGGAVMATPLGGGAVSTIAAGGAPESISLLGVPDPATHVDTGIRFVVWANRTELQVFSFFGGVPQPMLGSSTVPADWNPTQMFPANESIALFDAAHPGLYGFNRFFIPGGPLDELPPYRYSPIGAEPAFATALSTPMHRFWTDGSTIAGRSFLQAP